MGRQRNLLHPEMQKKANEFEKRCKAAGLNVKITETFRTVAEQNGLYAQGRTKPGRIVTRAKGGDYQSPHQWGVAFDFCENVRGKEYADTSFFKKCGDIGKSIGLFWGGDFRTFVDRPHLELPKYLPKNSTSTLKSKHGTPDKFIATWTGSHGHKKSPSKPVTAVKKDTPKQAVTKKLQKTLGVTADGIFGDKTKAKVGGGIRQGARGKMVEILQEALNLYGYKLKADGVFGSATGAAVRSFQKSRKLKTDGIVGKATWEKLLK